MATLTPPISKAVISSRLIAAAMLCAFAGGYGDATGYLLAETFTGHVTGNIVLLAVALPGAHPAQLLPRIVAILCFLAATAVGFLLVRWHHARASLLAFLAQAVLLLTIVTPQARHSAHFSLLLIIALCLSLGLQNGVVTKIAGVSLHPTFVSGDFTNLLATWLPVPNRRGTPAKPRNGSAPRILITVIVSFCLGAFAARLLAAPLGDLLPASLLLPLLAAALSVSTQPSLPKAEPARPSEGT